MRLCCASRPVNQFGIDERRLSAAITVPLMLAALNLGLEPFLLAVGACY